MNLVTRVVSELETVKGISTHLTAFLMSERLYYETYWLVRLPELESNEAKESLGECPDFLKEEFEKFLHTHSGKYITIKKEM